MDEWVDRYLDRIGGLLLPPRCVLCGSRGQAPCLDLCAGCAADFEAAGEPVLAGPAPLRRSCAPYSYAWPLDHLVHVLKYRGRLATARVLGTLLARWLAARGLQHEVDVIVPVPLHPARHAERGFNQSAELAGQVARNLRLPVVDSLAVRRRATSPQVGLDLDERRSNLAGAFAATPAARGLRIALLDDVTTTGRTLQELASVLLEAGAAAVDGWCVARADRFDASSTSGQTPHDRIPTTR
jgi:ComF family protein